MRSAVGTEYGMLGRVALVLACAVVTHSSGEVCGGVREAAQGGVLQRLRGGMADDMAAQMAEIRAMRAKQYQQQKAAESAEEKQAAAEAQSYVGAQKVWAIATDKLNANTIQPKRSMAKGDARAFYLDGGVSLLRNRNTGMVLELLHDSKGWFQFLAREGSSLQQVSAAGLLVPAQRLYAAGLLEEIKNNPLKANLISSKGVTEGPWSLSVKGASVVITHADDPTREIHLIQDGFVYTSKSADEGMHIDSTGSPAYMPLAEAEAIVSSLSN